MSKSLGYYHNSDIYYDVLIVIYKGLWMLHHRILLPNTHTFKIW